MGIANRLKTAAEEGLVIGVKYGIVVALILGALIAAGWDYARVRVASTKGEQAYLYILDGVNAGKLPPQWAKPAEPAKPADLGTNPETRSLPVPTVTPKKP